MMTQRWTRSLGALALGLTATAGLAHAQQPAAPAPAAPAPNQAPAPAPNQGGQLADGEKALRALEALPEPADALRNAQMSLKMAFVAADQNHDGLISQREAIDAGNLMVGGFFFAADADGDGSVTQEEARAIRERILKNNPLLKFALQRAKDPNQQNLAGTDALKNVAGLLDVDNNNALTAKEVRSAVQSAVQGAFAVADTNRDNQMSPEELNAAVYGMARAAAQASFQAADKDNNGSLSKEEFTQALVEPASSVFDVLDANLDGQLEQNELQRAAQVILSQLQNYEFPDADNSLDSLIRSGRRPQDVTPIPAVPATPRTPR